MKITKTKKGWMFDYNGNDGMLISGTIIGRKVLYNYDTLDSLGIRPDADPDAAYTVGGITIGEYLQHQVMPDKVLCRGHKVL